MGILKQHSTNEESIWDKDVCQEQTEKHLDEIYESATKLVAEGKQSLLIVLQGMDGSGKDSLTRAIFEKVSPTMVNVHSFKKPTDLEFSHDFLWRIHDKVPVKGMITVFNRSHYEDVLVPSVYGYIDAKTIEARYQQINDFEKMLEASGTTIVKFYLNISKEKQEEKLIERINNPEKHWKHSDGDWETREQWDEFMKVYETVFEKCNVIPWDFIPCDENWQKIYAASKKIAETLKEMNPQFPPLKSEKFTPDYLK